MFFGVIIVGGVIIGLFILYITRPYYRPVHISSAHFLPDKTAQSSSRRLNLHVPVLPLSFWLKLIVFVFALVALIVMYNFGRGQSIPQIGLWIAVDTSASMTTHDGNGTRTDRAFAALNELETMLNNLDQDRSVCLQVWGFDLILRELSPRLEVSQLGSTAPLLSSRMLGTDITIVNRLLQVADETRQKVSEPGICNPTHLMVLTDQPKPATLSEDTPLPMIWYGVGNISENYGIMDLQPSGNAAFGGVTGLNVTVGAWGGTGTVEVSIWDNSGQVIATQEARFDTTNQRLLSFNDVPAGQITIQVSPGGSYAYDDDATIIQPDHTSLKVDWRVSADFDPAALGWVQDTESPHLRVQAWDSPLPDDTTPTLLIGNGFIGPPTQIDRFVDSSPLLENLNLDLAEKLGAAGVNLPEASPLTPVLIDNEDGVWFAQSSIPPLALVPSLPIFTSDRSMQAFSSTGFFNAAAWLLQQYRAPALYSLTSPSNIEIGIGHLPLHFGEGDTSLQTESDASILNSLEWSEVPEDVPFWPVFVMLATCLFAIERILTMLRGQRWD